MTDEDLNKLGNLIDSRLDEKLKPINKELESINKNLNDPNAGLDSINKKLNDPETGLGSINNKLDALTIDMHDVQQKVGTTYDLVKLIKEKHEEEFDEIREH